MEIMALGHRYTESRCSADGEVGAESSAGNSQKLLRGRVDLDMHGTHTHDAGLAQ